MSYARSPLPVFSTTIGIMLAFIFIFLSVSVLSIINFPSPYKTILHHKYYSPFKKSFKTQSVNDTDKEENQGLATPLFQVTSRESSQPCSSQQYSAPPQKSCAEK
jgi:hypothetical protein